MKWHQTIKAKFAFFYAMTALVLGIIYSGCVVYVQFNTEAQLMASTMDSMLVKTVEDDIMRGRSPKLDSLSTLYIQGDSVTPIPEQFKKLPDGYSEYTNDEELHIYAKTINGKRYILTRLQADFEKWERQQFMKGLILLGLVMLVSFGIGFYFIRQSFRPLDRLMSETRELDRRLREGILDNTVFSGEWAQDEIGELAAGFKALTQRLEKLLEGERRFASEVSHELRTPMTVIGMSIELLEDAPNLTAHQKEIIQRAKRTSVRMNELLEVFLNISRGGSGKASRVASVAEVIREMMPVWQADAKAKGLEFVYSGHDGSSGYPGGNISEGDRTGNQESKQYNAVLVAAIFNNLVMNAIRYTDQGKVTVSVEGNRFRVSDTGPGIPLHDREHIFDLGYRGAIMENSSKVGYGLGLAIAMRICAILGWDISMDSAEGKGSVFTVSTR